MNPIPPVHRFTLMGRDISFDPALVSPRDAVRSGAVPVRSLALDISGRCNLRCAYCAEAATLPSRSPMRKEVLERSLDVLFAQAPERSAVSVHLGSGEPLLRPSLVRMIGEIVRRKERETGTPADLYITTNATLLTDLMAAHLRDYGWNVKISIDGPPDIQNRFRPDTCGSPTFDRVSRALRQLSALMPGTLSTTSVLCHGTDPSSVFYSIAGMGVTRIELVPVALPHNPDLSLTEADLAAYRRFIQDYARQLGEGRNLPTHIRFKKRLGNVMGFFTSGIACDAGRSFLAVGPEGTLYPCFRFVGLQAYALGHLDDGIADERRAWFAGGIGRPYQLRDCAGCWAAPLCGGPCFAVTELICHGRPDPIYCELVRAEAEAALYLADVLREQDPERLLALAGIPVVVEDEDHPG